jgi:hypothetical protein
LADEEAFRRAPKVELLRDRGEVGQLPELDGGVAILPSVIADEEKPALARP